MKLYYFCKLMLFALIINMGSGSLLVATGSLDAEVVQALTEEMQGNIKKEPFLTTKKIVVALFVLAAAGLVSWAVYKMFIEKAQVVVLEPVRIQRLDGPIDINFVVGDITQQQFQDQAHAAIVNAANELMLGGGGIDGAIHRAAGPGLRQECFAVPQVAPGIRCPTGEARITGGHNLAPIRIIHTVGPDVRPHGGQPNTGDVRRLENCYRSVLDVAQRNGVRAVAIPSISTGIFEYPLPDATRVAAQVINEVVAHNPTAFQEIRFVGNAPTMAAYRRAFAP